MRFAARFARSLAVAFALYSRIPVPIFEWKEEDMKFNLVFLPWVGAVIGACVYACAYAARTLDLPLCCQTALVSAIPLFVTGGFHFDGFMDVQDALRSYRPREEKLRILKDPRISAFAAIGALKYAALWVAALSLLLAVPKLNALAVFAAYFFTVRAIAGLTAATFKRARKEGMLVEETRGTDRGVVLALALEIAIGVLAAIWADPAPGTCAAIAAAACAWNYRRLSLREFGGVTGDTTGYFVARCELAVMIAVACPAWLLK